MQCRCRPSSPDKNAVLVDHVRLFRNEPRHRWEHRIHEQILPSLRCTNVRIERSDVVIQHTGYLTDDDMRRKWERNLRLLREELRDHPDDAHVLLHLGLTHMLRQEVAEALPVFQKAASVVQPYEPTAATVFAQLGKCWRVGGQPQQGLRVIEHGRRYHPHQPELIAEQSELCWSMGDFDGAERCLLELMNPVSSSEFSHGIEGQHDVIAIHRLAVIRLEQGRFDEAEALWHRVLQRNSEFLQAHRGLHELTRRRNAKSKD